MVSHCAFPLSEIQPVFPKNHQGIKGGSGAIPFRLQWVKAIIHIRVGLSD